MQTSTSCSFTRTKDNCVYDRNTLIHHYTYAKILVNESEQSQNSINLSIKQEKGCTVSFSAREAGRADLRPKPKAALTGRIP